MPGASCLALAGRRPGAARRGGEAGRQDSTSPWCAFPRPMPSRSRSGTPRRCAAAAPSSSPAPFGRLRPPPGGDRQRAPRVPGGRSSCPSTSTSPPPTREVRCSTRGGRSWGWWRVRQRGELPPADRLRLSRDPAHRRPAPQPERPQVERDDLPGGHGGAPARRPASLAALPDIAVATRNAGRAPPLMWSDRLPEAERARLAARLRAILPAPRARCRASKTPLRTPEGEAARPRAGGGGAAGRAGVRLARRRLRPSPHAGHRLYARPLATLAVRQGRATVNGPGGGATFAACGFDLLAAAFDAWGERAPRAPRWSATSATSWGASSRRSRRRRPTTSASPTSTWRSTTAPSSGTARSWTLEATDAWREVAGRDRSDPVLAAERVLAAAGRRAAPAGRDAASPRIPGARRGQPPRPRRFEAEVTRTVERIASGEIFQMNLCRRLEAALPASGLWPFYRRLRAASPADFGAFLDLGERARRALDLPRALPRPARRRGEVESRPIKGTRPRGANPREDRALARELLESEKDRAELTMIVDVVRNDLGRVCATGSVEVTSPRRADDPADPPPHRLDRARAPAAGRRSARAAARRLPAGLDHRRAEDPGDGRDRRRGGAAARPGDGRPGVDLAGRRPGAGGGDPHRRGRRAGGWPITPAAASSPTRTPSSNSPRARPRRAPSSPPWARGRRDEPGLVERPARPARGGPHRSGRRRLPLRRRPLRNPAGGRRPGPRPSPPISTASSPACGGSGSLPGGPLRPRPRRHRRGAGRAPAGGAAADHRLAGTAGRPTRLITASPYEPPGEDLYRRRGRRRPAPGAPDRLARPSRRPEEPLLSGEPAGAPAGRGAQGPGRRCWSTSTAGWSKGRGATSRWSCRRGSSPLPRAKGACPAPSAAACSKRERSTSGRSPAKTSPRRRGCC